MGNLAELPATSGKVWVVLALARSVLSGLVLSGLVLGCHREAPEPLPVRAVRPPPYVPSSNSTNTFDTYARVAQDVENDPEIQKEKYLNQLSFYPGQRENAVALCAKYTDQIISASRNSCEFKFTPRPPFEVAPYHRGWRLIGHCLRWRIDAAIEATDYDTAVETLLAATRFGYDLTGGGATDASLGFAIADDCRVALVPFLDALSAGQLGRLAEGLEAALKRRPPLSLLVAHEQANSLLAVQGIQDAFVRNQLGAYCRPLGSSVADAVQFLDDLRGKDAKVRVYFDGFVSEANNEAQTAGKLAELPGLERAKVPLTKLADYRPWKRFARAFFVLASPALKTGPKKDDDKRTWERPLFTLADRSVARSRMLGVMATMLRHRKNKEPIPRNLDDLSVDLAADPFDGGRFRFVNDGTDFRVYSIGSNLRDDGGDTDDAYANPDLTLERR